MKHLRLYENFLEEGYEVAVIDMKDAASSCVTEITDALNYASAKLYDLKKMSDEIKLEFPDLSKSILNTVEPMMIELENEYPKKLKELLVKFV
jgi:hypothetical protein